MEYDNYKDCFVQVSLLRKVDIKLTVSNFKSEDNKTEQDWKTWLDDFLEIYEGPIAQKRFLKRFEGDVGSISHEWMGEIIVLRWKTDSNTTYNSMTAFIDIN